MYGARLQQMDARRAEHRYAYEHADDFYNTVEDTLLLTQFVPGVKLAREVRQFANADQFQG